VNRADPFPSYLQLREQGWLPAWAWAAGRVASVVVLLLLAGTLIWAPATGLRLLWRLAVPMLPLVWLLVPGVWRNLCPLAAANQLPRNLGLARNRVAPPWFKEYGYVVGIFAFFLLASARRWLFNQSGPAAGLLLLGALAAAFLGGLLLKGKSGWCSSLCPLYPVQRLYNQTPFLPVGNRHCDPCVGCTRNCYDFNPGAAALADAYDEDPHYSGYRRFFAAAMPGFIIAFFTAPGPPEAGLGSMYLRFGLALAASLGLFAAAETFLRISVHRLAALWAAAALNLFYGFGMGPWLGAVGGLFHRVPPPALILAARAGIALLTLVWLVRTFAKEPRFLEHMAQQGARLSSGAASLLLAATGAPRPEVEFQPVDRRVAVDSGRTLLEIAEASQLPLEAGCRMGQCGADPVRITAGMENLPPKGPEERATLQRLGLGADCRLACMCKVRGPVAVDLRPRAGAGPPLAAPAPVLEADPGIRTVVVVGNGIAGVTAADHVRRNHPDCEIHILAREKHPLYNRMAITRLIYGRSAMAGLYLQPEGWYEGNRITCWLNTSVRSLDPGRRELQLATGETLGYDRLILAAGSRSLVPPVQGYGLPGTFVLREAEDAMEVRAFIQDQGGGCAVVAGGGLLGLEAAYALRRLCRRVVVLERSPWLLKRQMDAQGAAILTRHLQSLGIEVLAQAELSAIRGELKVSGAVLKDGRMLDCELVLVAAGIQPNTELARQAGLVVRRGVVVDAGMRTSDPDIFAAGDMCELDGSLPGLWPVAVEQARIAACNALGGREAYREAPPVTTLKVTGVELTSVGRVEARDEDEVIAQAEPDQHRYRMMLLASGRAQGAILLGYPETTTAVTAAVKACADLAAHREALRTGRWEVLEGA
jgi:nitrite reductase (NADH) large subunit